MSHVHPIQEVAMFSGLSLFASFQRGQTRRTAAHALRGLSAAQLDDIGIAPDQIDDVVDAMWKRARSDQDRAAARTRSGGAALPVRIAAAACASAGRRGRG